MYWCEPHKVGPHVATWQVELQQYHYKLYHKPGENMCTDTLSCCSDFDTRNPMNNHLIVLPLNCFIGMLEAICLLLNKNSATSEITLSSEELDSEESLTNNLNSKVKQGQDDHYNCLMRLRETHHL
jgi:hypothetical protein